MRVTTLIVLLVLASCNSNKPAASTHTIDFGAFTIETPASWQKVEQRGADSYVGSIAIDKKDTLFFDLGWYSNKLTEEDPVMIDRSTLLNMKNPDTAGYIIVDKDTHVDMDKYRKNNVHWDTIDNYLAKIVYPRKTGTGTTGVYIDSLWRAGSDVDRFNLYGTNLQPANEKLVLEALKTIKFHKR